MGPSVSHPRRGQLERPRADDAALADDAARNDSAPADSATPTGRDS